MIKHKPIPKADVDIDGTIYKCNAKGIVELPEAYPQFNPIEEDKIDRKAKKANKK